MRALLRKNVANRADVVEKMGLADPARADDGDEAVIARSLEDLVEQFRPRNDPIPVGDQHRQTSNAWGSRPMSSPPGPSSSRV